MLILRNSIKSKSPEQFNSVVLFRNIMLILERHNFRLPVRRFVVDLFDKSILRRIVLEDDYGNESDTQSSEARRVWAG